VQQVPLEERVLQTIGERENCTDRRGIEAEKKSHHESSGLEYTKSNGALLLYGPESIKLKNCKNGWQVIQSNRNT